MVWYVLKFEQKLVHIQRNFRPFQAKNHFHSHNIHDATFTLKKRYIATDVSVNYFIKYIAISDL